MRGAVRRLGWRLKGVIALGVIACGGSSRPADGQVPPGAPGSTQAPPAAQGSNTSGRACATPDDSTGTSISGTFAGRPGEVYLAGSAALRELGYAVLETVPGREMITAPSYAWPRGSEREPWHGSEHPGVEVFVYTRAVADSTTVTVGARALCKVAGTAGGPRDSQVGTNLEGIITLTVMNALINRMRVPPR